MYKYNIFYKIYNHQLLKTRAFKSENPQGGLFFTKSKAIQNLSLNLSFTWV